MATNTKSASQKSGNAEQWENQRKSCYDVEALREEYCERLYSDEGLKLLKPDEPASPTPRKQK